MNVTTTPYQKIHIALLLLKNVRQKLDNDTKKLTELEFLLLDFMNNDDSVQMYTWNKLWRKIAKKFGTKEATNIYNQGCEYLDDPESEEDFIESYM